MLDSQMCRSRGVYHHHCFLPCMLLHARPRPLEACARVLPVHGGRCIPRLLQGGTVLLCVGQVACNLSPAEAHHSPHSCLKIDSEPGCTVTAHATAGDNSHAATGTDALPACTAHKRIWSVHAAHACCLSQRCTKTLGGPATARSATPAPVTCV